MGTEHFTMRELPDGERPYEKFKAFGAAALTDAELLAIIIRTGAQGTNILELIHQVLNLDDSGDGILTLHRLSLEDLQSVKGIGEVKAVQLKCIGEISRRISKASARTKLNFSNPSTIAGYYMEDMRHARQEQMILLMLDTKNRMLGDSIISKGTVNASLLSPREIFIEALQKQAVFIILLHNHPSGDPTPSREDISITKKIKEAGILIGIHLLDHLIIGDNTYISFHEKGIL